MTKPHLEFFGVDLNEGWASPPGYPAGVQQKILASDLDETASAAAVRASCASSRVNTLRRLSSTITGKKFTCSPAISSSATMRRAMAGRASRLQPMPAVRRVLCTDRSSRWGDACSYEVHYYEKSVS